jgi:hypothetical protein
MFAFKSCPRCRGDMYVNSAGDRSCIQCGHEPGPFSSRVATHGPRFPHLVARSRSQRIHQNLSA